MRRHLPWLVVIAALAGFWLSQDLVGLHYELKYEPEKAAQSACEQGESLSCGAVNSSKWSELPLGEGRAPLPTAVPAVGFFVMSGVLALLALFGTEERRRKVLAIVAGFAAIGVLVGLWLIWIQAFVLKAWCLFCLGVDAASLIVLVAAALSHDGGLKGVVSDLKQMDRSLAAIAVVLILAIGGGSYGSYNSRVQRAEADRGSLVDDGGQDRPQPTAQAHGPGDGHDHGDEQPKTLEEMSPEEVAGLRQELLEFYGAYMAQPVQELEVSPFDLVKGNPEAKVVVAEFADFQCPYCRLVAFELKPIAQRYYDHVQFVFKHYPLGLDCNEFVSKDMHPEACEAAVAVQCARRKGEGWLYHDHTFDNASALGTRKLLGLAEEVGLDRDWFAECLEKESVWNEVRTQVDQGAAIGVSGTPTVFINGREILSLHPLALEGIIRLELKNLGVPVDELPADPYGLFP